MRRAAVALLLLALFGCAERGSADRAASTGDEATAEDDSAGVGGVGEGGGGDGTGVQVVAASAAQLPDAGRSVIRTATLRVGTDEVERTSAEALAVVERAGGFLAGASTDLAGETSATLVYRVPPERFAAVLDELAGLGDLEQRDVDSQDVTAQVVDLDGRLAAVRASVDRLRLLIADAADVPQIVAIEGELARREGELESLTGQLRALRSQVDLATVTLELREPSPAAAVSDDIPGFGGGLEAGVVAVGNATKVALTATGFLLPFAALAVLVGAPLVWVVRRRRNVAPEPAA